MSAKRQEPRPARDEPVADARPGASVDAPSDEDATGSSTSRRYAASNEDAGVGEALRRVVAEAVIGAVTETSVDAILGARDGARKAGIEAAKRTMADRRRTPVGVDGCKQGWLAVVGTSRSGRVEVHERFESILADHPDALVVVDIPMGLVDSAEGRRADELMRKRLGCRRSSVFTAPSRAALDATDYEDAKKRNRKATGKSLSRQTWGLVPKIREVDGLLTPSRQERVREGHPEVAFASLSGKPMAYSKKTPAGITERRRVLRAAGYGLDRLEACLPPRSKAGIDDLLDACVLHDVACRILDGSAQALPETEERDFRGLLMQVWHAPR